MGHIYIEDIYSPDIKIIDSMIRICVNKPETFFMVIPIGHGRNVISWNDNPCDSNTKYPCPVYRDERKEKISQALKKQFSGRCHSYSMCGFLISDEWRSDLEDLEKIFSEDASGDRIGQMAGSQGMQESVLSFLKQRGWEQANEEK